LKIEEASTLPKPRQCPLIGRADLQIFVNVLNAKWNEVTNVKTGYQTLLFS
jgi:hypothetical protein